MTRPASRLPAALAGGVIALSLVAARPAAGQQTDPVSTEPAPSETAVDVNQIFASTCGWCHADGGRAPGKGPQLMDTKRSDEFIRSRIKLGKEGAMPAFGEVFDDTQIDAIVKYIRTLKPDPG